MALSRSRRMERSVNYWPGFVDALSTLLLAIMFLLSVFVIAQYVLSQEISGKDEVLTRLNTRIEELTSLLAMEKAGKQDIEDNLANLQASLSTTQAERSRLQQMLAEQAANGAGADEKLGNLNKELDEEKQLSRAALSQVELLNQQISALRRQIAALEDALQVSESKDRESQTRIVDLGKRLNVALAKRVQELNRYRSDFFGKLRDILGGRNDIRVVGDRFVFQSEVLFSSGSDQLNEEGKAQMKKVAEALIAIGKEIPPEINWVVRVDGHTDNVPLSGTGQFKDNWALSSARATSVVKFLVASGVPADRLVAAGFGEYQPIVTEDSEEARAKNRRIELKLTDR